MPYDLIPVTGQPGLAFPALPALFAPDAGTARRVIEFFTANIRNPHTRKAHAKAAGEFAVWCDRHGIEHLGDVQPVHVAAYMGV